MQPDHKLSKNNSSIAIINKIRNRDDVILRKPETKKFSIENFNEKMKYN